MNYTCREAHIVIAVPLIDSNYRHRHSSIFLKHDLSFPSPSIVNIWNSCASQKTAQNLNPSFFLIGRCQQPKHYKVFIFSTFKLLSGSGCSNIVRTY